MFENGLIIKTRKLTASEVKNKLRNFIDDIAEGCGPEVTELAEELKQHGDDFVDALTGNGKENGGYTTAYRRARAWHRNGGPENGGIGTMYRNGSPENGTMYRNEGSWQEREEQRKRNEAELNKLERHFQELKARMRDY